MTSNWKDQLTHSGTGLPFRGSRQSGGIGQQEPHAIEQGKTRSPVPGRKTPGRNKPLPKNTQGSYQTAGGSRASRVLRQQRGPPARWALVTGAQPIDQGKWSLHHWPAPTGQHQDTASSLGSPSPGWSLTKQSKFSRRQQRELEPEHLPCGRGWGNGSGSVWSPGRA